MSTPAFGGGQDKGRGPDYRGQAYQAMKRMLFGECSIDPACHAEAARQWEEAIKCIKNPKSCRGSKPVSCPDGYNPTPGGDCLPKPPAPKPVSCPDGSAPINPCLLESFIPLVGPTQVGLTQVQSHIRAFLPPFIEFEEDSTPKPLACPEGYVPLEFEEGKELIQVCVGYPSEPSPSCPLGYDEDSQKIVQICNTAEFDSYVKKQAHFTRHHPLCKADDIIPWEVARRICEINANAENQKRCAWRHPFYTSPIAQDVMETWEMTTMVELLACATTVVAPPMGHFCLTAAGGWAGKRLVKWLAPKWPASKPVCFELVEIEQACDAWATEVVCTD
jgi:hypothetical protein